MGGGTWIYLGRFPFAAGRQEVVTLSNRSRTGGRIVSADAVKIGGGYGNGPARPATRCACPARSMPGDQRLPRFTAECATGFQWAGFPEEVYTPKNNIDDYKRTTTCRAPIGSMP